MCHHKSGCCKTPILQHDRMVGALNYLTKISEFDKEENLLFYEKLRIIK
jgi:hypothetical protein